MSENNKKMEEDIKSIQKHMGGLVRTIIDLKTKVESLEERLKGNQKDDLAELMVKQTKVDEAITANSNAIQNIDDEIKVLSQNTKKKASIEVNQAGNKEGRGRKCRYYNRGHCRNKGGCEFVHPKEICKVYLEGKRCEVKECLERHPKVCEYWLKSNSGCRREGFCDFLHVTVAREDEKIKIGAKEETLDFECVGCKSSWEDKRCVVEHIKTNHQVFFCLNCDDWVKDKSKVLEQDWSLFDIKGNLRYDV